MREVPYPADTRAKGWRFELDHERIRQSDTWALAAPDVRPWLLMMWMVAWEQTPCGSLPNDDALIAARIGMQAKAFAKNRATLLRGWWPADDGRMYHDTIAERVFVMLDKRATDAQRAATRRARVADATVNHAIVTRDAGVTTHGARPEFDTKHQAPEEEKATSDEVAGARPSDDHAPQAAALKLVQAEKARSGPPDCPHQAVLAVWAETLPSMPQHSAAHWRGSRADHLRARWRETAVEKGWTTQQQGLDYLRRLFAYVGASPFLTGREHGRDRRPFFVELAWLVEPTNWAKVIEGKYHATRDEATA